MDTEPTVRDNPDRQRYEVLVDGVVVGYAEHHPAGAGVEVFPHTVVSPEHEGKGLAGVLVRHALDDVRARGVKVEPTCWYVARWIGRHEAYQDLLASSPA
jgi:predicted GNAT family acetyltransferase